MTTFAGALSIALAAGCAVDASSGDPPVGQSSQGLLGITLGPNLSCQPLTCCFPTGGGWSNNPFEESLRALGCTTPRAYTESFERSNWWLYSSCPVSLQLTELVAANALVSPTFSQVAINVCLELDAIGRGQPDTAFVEWDPTCSSCSYATTYNDYYFIDPAENAQAQQGP